MEIVRRHLEIPLPPGRSAFLWGPRRVGKTWWIHHHFLTGKETLLDLLETDTFAEYAARPSLLRERWMGRLTVIDEVQKIPALLDEVHWLMERKKASFLLTGSSSKHPQLQRVSSSGRDHFQRATQLYKCRTRDWCEREGGAELFRDPRGHDARPSTSPLDPLARPANDSDGKVLFF